MNTGSAQPIQKNAAVEQQQAAPANNTQHETRADTQTHQEAPQFKPLASPFSMNTASDQNTSVFGQANPFSQAGLYNQFFQQRQPQPANAAQQPPAQQQTYGYQNGPAGQHIAPVPNQSVQYSMQQFPTYPNPQQQALYMQGFQQQPLQQQVQQPQYLHGVPQQPVQQSGYVPMRQAPFDTNVYHPEYLRMVNQGILRQPAMQNVQAVAVPPEGMAMNQQQYGLHAIPGNYNSGSLQVDANRQAHVNVPATSSSAPVVTSEKQNTGPLPIGEKRPSGEDITRESDSKKRKLADTVEQPDSKPNEADSLLKKLIDENLETKRVLAELKSERVGQVRLAQFVETHKMAENKEFPGSEEFRKLLSTVHTGDDNAFETAKLLEATIKFFGATPKAGGESTEQQPAEDSKVHRAQFFPTGSGQTEKKAVGKTRAAAASVTKQENTTGAMDEELKFLLTAAAKKTAM